MSDAVAQRWRIDRRIPLALVLAIAVQTGGAVWWLANLSARVSTIEEAAIARQDERDRLIVLETELRAVNATLVRIERRLDRDTTALK